MTVLNIAEFNTLSSSDNGLFELLQTEENA